MFCPTSALSGGGVRGVLPPPPRSRGSLLPPTPQRLRGLSASGLGADLGVSRKRERAQPVVMATRARLVPLGG